MTAPSPCASTATLTRGLDVKYPDSGPISARAIGNVDFREQHVGCTSSAPNPASVKKVRGADVADALEVLLRGVWVGAEERLGLGWDQALAAERSGGVGGLASRMGGVEARLGITLLRTASDFLVEQKH
jgi:hypothetical protein